MFLAFEWISSVYWQVDIEHKGRFFDDFGAEGDEEETNQEVEADPPTKRDKDISEGFKGGKPADFRALFSGNNDDHFRIGLKFTRWNHWHLALVLCCQDYW